MSGVFVSYRRADSQGWAGRLEAELGAAFGDVARFFDLASIAPGADFRAEIDRRLAASDAVLVLIGPRWLDLRAADGSRRLDAADDVVAAEVAAALALPTSVPVIPVLLGGAAMPGANGLPARLAPLAGRNAIELSDSRWDYDCRRLLAAIEAATPLRQRTVKPETPATAADAAPAVKVGAGLEASDAEIGRVTGVRGALPAGSVGVLEAAKLQRVKIGDITGIEVPPSPAPPK